MIKCYDVNGVELGTTIKEIYGRGSILILETYEDYQELKNMVEKDECKVFRYYFDKIYSQGCYKYFDDYDRFLKEFSYEDACNILKLYTDNKKIVCYAENNKYYVGVFDECE